MKLFSKQPGFRQDFNLLPVFGMERILLDILFDDYCSSTYIRFETNLYICFPLIHNVKLMQEPDLNLYTVVSQRLTHFHYLRKSENVSIFGKKNFWSKNPRFTDVIHSRPIL